MSKPKSKKSPDKPKTPEPKNKSKKKAPPKKVFATVRIPALKAASRTIKREIERNEKRQYAIERAAAFLRRQGISFDKGNFLLIVNSVKVMFAFDHPELLESLQANADITKLRLVHLEAGSFENLERFDRVISEAVEQGKSLASEAVKITNKRRLKKLQKPLDRNIRQV